MGDNVAVSDTTHDLGAIFDKHVADEFVAKDVDATMSTMSDDPFVNHVPTMMGGVGRAGVRSFYASYFIGHWPEDTALTPVSRTVGADRVVEEMVISFTHDVPMPTFLPGVAPTGRPVRLPLVVVMGFEADKVAYEPDLLGSGVAVGPGRAARRGVPADHRRCAVRQGPRQGTPGKPSHRASGRAVNWELETLTRKPRKQASKTT
jgi:carboxymethylenebutenolidase